jgi:hypothetical protein
MKVENSVWRNIIRFMMSKKIILLCRVAIMRRRVVDYVICGKARKKFNTTKTKIYVGV